MLSFHIIYGTDCKVADKRRPEKPGGRKTPAHQGTLKINPK